MPLNDQDYALVIGINDYPNYKPLRGAIRDANDFADWLLDERLGGRLPPENCHTIFSQPDPLKPLKDDIDVALVKIRNQVEESGARRFYLYFSGHGQAEKRNDVNLCLARWSEDDFTRVALSFQDCCDYIDCIGFTQVLVFLDCCRMNIHGATGQVLGATCTPPLGADSAYRFIAYSTTHGSSSYEAYAASMPGGVWGGPVVRGHFSRALLAALKGGAACSKGGVLLSDLHQYLVREVNLIAQKSEHNQKARVSNEFSDDNMPILGYALPLVSVEIRFGEGLHGEIVLEGPDLEVIRRDDVSTGPWALELQRGRYYLCELESGKGQHFRCDFQEGGHHVVFD